MRWFPAFALALLLAALGPVPEAVAERRVALVIGNSAYRHTPPLANPANDAADIAERLRRLGFEVFAEFDLTKSGMDGAFRRFARALEGADAALFFYAGHGMQFQGFNYLMPVDAKLEHEADLPYEMAKFDDVLADMARATRVRIAVLDACRDNPLEERLKRSLARTRNIPMTRGLARPGRTDGLLIAFATQPGDVAEDGTGRNSPFTGALLRHIETPGLEVGPLFRRVAAAVHGETKGRQTPELSVSLLGEFYFAGDAMPPPVLDAAAPAKPPAPAPSGPRPLDEREAFESARAIDTPAAWDAFLARFSTGFYADMARAARDKLRAADLARQEADRRRQEQAPKVVAPAPPQVAAIDARRSLWDHNGSVMDLAADGAAREFHYSRPSARMRNAVTALGPLLFSGKKVGNRYEGTAYVYSSRCGRKYPYRVAGDVAADGASVTLRGAAPVIASNCAVARYEWNDNSTLVFTYLRSE